MSLPLIHEIWKVVRPSLEAGALIEASEMLVNYLIDSDYDIDDIKFAFKNDYAIQKALSFFAEKSDNGFILEEEEDFDDEEYDEDPDDDRY